MKRSQRLQIHDLRKRMLVCKKLKEGERVV